MRRKEPESGDLSGFLDVGTEFRGELSFQDTLRIDGKFEGSIRAGKMLVIGESADVNAEIDVANVSVNGRVRGSVRASARVELHETARAECSVDTKVLVVKEGARFEGQCSMQGDKAASGPREVAPSDKLKSFITSE